LQQKIGDMRSLMAKFRGIDRNRAVAGGSVVGIGLAASGASTKDAYAASGFAERKTARI
jgi:hypothetical protein